MRCYCCSDTPFEKCCSPLLDGTQSAASPEQLMRSRFSAYCTGNFTYVLATYVSAQRQNLSVEALAESAQDAQWFALNINAVESDTVTFTAFYFAQAKPAQLHETSQFVREQGQWRYQDGTIHSDTGRVTLGRNDPCPCLSGKKFKQCCLKRARR